LTEFTPSYSLTHNGDDAPQNSEDDRLMGRNM